MARLEVAVEIAAPHAALSLPARPRRNFSGPNFSGLGSAASIRCRAVIQVPLTAGQGFAVGSAIAAVERLCQLQMLLRHRQRLLSEGLERRILP